MDTLREFLAAHGVRSKSGKLLGKEAVAQILTNPIYYGHFKYAGEVHEGTHQPIISKKLFDEVQAVLTRRFRWSKLKKPIVPKPFSGLLRCRECNSAITAEIQKGHTYYRCTKKNKACRCTQPYIREEALDIEISRLLSPFSLKSEWADDMLVRLDGERKLDAQASNIVVAEKRAGIAQINARLQRLLDGFLDGVIEREVYAAEKAKLMSEKKTLEEQSSALSIGRKTWLEPMRNWILDAKSAGEIALTGSRNEKKVLASKVFGSNLVLDGKKASGSAIKPFALLREAATNSEMVGVTGLEPVTSSMSRMRSSQLSYTPIGRKG